MATATPPSADPPIARRWYSHTLHSIPGLCALGVVVIILVVAIVAPFIWGTEAAVVDPTSGRLGPSLEHPFGTDELGRDVLVRVLVGTRATLLYTLGAVVLSTVLGVGIGLLAALLGQRARQVMYQISATATAFPSILLAVLLATLFGRSGIAAMTGLAIAGAPQIARLTMNLATAASGSEAVLAAKTIGVRGPRLLARYILPQVAEPIATLTIMTAASYLIALSALSFVGLGVQAPEWDWGAMLNGALANIYTIPTAIIGPGIAVVLTGVAFNVLGESLAAGIDPRNRLRARPSAGRLRARDRRSGLRPSAAPAVRAPSPPAPENEAIGIDDLTVVARTPDGDRPLLHGVSLSIAAGERVAIVGESGSGKSLTLASLAKLLPGGVEAHSSSHRFFGTPLGQGTEQSDTRLLGERLSMVFQDPMSTLNPALTISAIMRDKIPASRRGSRAETRAQLIRALSAVGIPDAKRKLSRHPHELSGGQRQRVMIAIALLGETDVLLADEPTTALDVSVQAQIVELLLEVSRSRAMSLVVVSHDLALVSRLCERIVVMYQGRIVEDGTTEQILTRPQHPYTRLLLAAIPSSTEPPAPHIIAPDRHLADTSGSNR